MDRPVPGKLKGSHSVQLEGKGSTWFHLTQLAPAATPGDRSLGQVREDLIVNWKDDPDLMIKATLFSFTVVLLMLI